MALLDDFLILIHIPTFSRHGSTWQRCGARRTGHGHGYLCACDEAVVDAAAPVQVLVHSHHLHAKMLMQVTRVASAKLLCRRSTQMISGPGGCRMLTQSVRNPGRVRNPAARAIIRPNLPRRPAYTCLRVRIATTSITFFPINSL